MSNIYITEPPTNGKVLLKTTVGDIEIELWSKECPKAARNFVQLCLEAYYDNTIFHRVVPGFIVQGGDPSGTGLGGSSIYGESFKDEFHSRLRFVRRGLVAMANGGSDDNGSQFFFTLDKAPELQDKHTIFGKVVGNTLFNMLKLGETEVDKNERPLFPQKILTAKVLINPFPDITPRLHEKKTTKKEAVVLKPKPKKNLKLLSFGDEMEEEETSSESIKVNKKSAHDLLPDDPVLRAEPAITDAEMRRIRGDAEAIGADETEEDREKTKKNVMEKLRNMSSKKDAIVEQAPLQEDDDLHSMLAEEQRSNERERLDSIKAEFHKLQKEYAKLIKKKEDEDDDRDRRRENPLLADYFAQRDRYAAKSATKEKDLSARQSKTLEILDAFKAKLSKMKEDMPEAAAGDEESDIPESDPEEDLRGSDWLLHKFVAKEEALVPAKNIHIYNEDTYDISDPRNPINKRRREPESKKNRRKSATDSQKRSKV